MQPPVGEWMNKQGHLCNGMLFSDKRSELSSHKKTWLDFKCILLNIRRLRSFMIILLNDYSYMTWKRQIIEAVNRSVVAIGSGEGRIE